MPLTEGKKVEDCGDEEIEKLERIILYLIRY
jgi:hypothetical protein